MNDGFPDNYSGIQKDRDSTSIPSDYKEETKALGAGSVLASGIMLPAEMAEDIYGPSDLYEDSVEFGTDLYFEGSEWIHEGIEVSFDLVNSLL